MFATPLRRSLWAGIALFSSSTYAEITEEMIVTANRIEKPLSTIPNTVSVIDEETLEQQLTVYNDVSTVLGNLIPSFSPSRQKMTNAGETLRGRKPLYLIDGIPQSNPLRNGGRDGHTIDPSVIERIEVLHGANAIHGLGAAGGIINLITRRPTDTLQQNVRVDSNFQSADVSDSTSYGISYGVSNRFENIDLLGSVSLRENGLMYDANNELIGVDNTQGDTMDSSTLNGLLKIGYHLDDNQRLEAMANHYQIEGNNEWISVAGDISANRPSSAVKGDIPGEGARNQVTTLSLTYTHADLWGHSVRAQLFNQDFEGTYGAETDPIATFQDEATYGPDLLDQSQNNSEKLGVKLTFAYEDIASLPLDVIYGLDVLQDETWQALIQTGRSWVPKSRYRNYAPYLQTEFGGIDNVTLTTGVRYEKSKLEVNDFTTLASYGSQFVEGGEPEFSETLYNLGGTYEFHSNWRVFANYAEAFSMPDVGRVLRGINVPGQNVETFLDLKPILTENTELGLEFNTDKVFAQLSYYTSDSDFGQRLQRGTDGIYTVKREKTEINGYEFRAHWQATADDRFGLQYSTTDGRYDSDGDGTVDTDLGGINIAPDRVNVSWERQWAYGIRTRAQANHLIDRDVSNSAGVTTNSFEGYTTVDLTLAVPAFTGMVNLGIQNLTNRDYYTYYSQSNPNNARYFKGLGRSFTLSFQKSF